MSREKINKIREAKRNQDIDVVSIKIKDKKFNACLGTGAAPSVVISKA